MTSFSTLCPATAKPAGILGTVGPPVVSVVIPNFDGARYLDDTFRSLAQQTTDAFEVIVMDGGSSDNSLEIVDRWTVTLPIVCVSEPDEGQAHAINKGFARASGQMLTWLNSDDLLTPRAIETAAEEFRRGDLDFLWSFCLVVDSELRPLHIANPFARTKLSELRQHRNFIPQPGSFYSRDLVKRIGPLRQDMHYTFDYEFFLRAAGGAQSRFVPEVLAWFRLHQDSKTSRYPIRFLREELKAFRAHGGRFISPFTLDFFRYWCLEPVGQLVKAPLRPLLRALFGLRKGARIRP